MDAVHKYDTLDVLVDVSSSWHRTTTEKENKTADSSALSEAADSSALSEAGDGENCEVGNIRNSTEPSLNVLQTGELKRGTSGTTLIEKEEDVISSTDVKREVVADSTTNSTHGAFDESSNKRLKTDTNVNEMK